MCYFRVLLIIDARVNFQSLLWCTKSSSTMCQQYLIQSYNFSHQLVSCKNLEICYKDNPCKPFLVYSNSIKADPYNNHIYQKTTKAPERNNQIEVETKKIVSQAQLINFLNIAFLPVNPNNEESYARKNLSMNDILSVVWKYSDIFSEKTAYGFAAVNDEQQKASVRSLYVLKDEYIDNVIEDIVSHSPRYQRFIQSLKDEGYHVIGYVRKSICEKDDDSRVRLLNLMCENLNNRSLVSKVFASVYCNANEPLLEGSTEI
ncbi:hypothetical protein EDC94DRAFT_653537 [Helicostylum pulchrum]|nr:hypothetical protein EDC94DRAFT_653537 [Helicostylum pulchrum]